MKLLKGDFSGENKSQQKKSTFQLKTVTLSEPGVSYSSMLLELLDSYIKESPEDLEEILNLGMVSWNLAISKSANLIGFDLIYEATVNSGGLNKKEKEIIKKIMKSKNDRFPEYNNFIENYQLSEDETGAIKVTVTHKPFDQFMSSGLMGNDEFEDFDPFNDIDELDELEYQEGYINRSSLLIKPKPAFWDWVKRNDPNFKIPEASRKYGVYLIPEKISEKQKTNWLKKNFDMIFVHEMESRFAILVSWPGKRTYQMFLDFFEIESQSMIMDLEKEPISKAY